MGTAGNARLRRTWSWMRPTNRRRGDEALPRPSCGDSDSIEAQPDTGFEPFRFLLLIRTEPPVTVGPSPAHFSHRSGGLLEPKSHCRQNDQSRLPSSNAKKWVGQPPGSWRWISHRFGRTPLSNGRRHRLLKSETQTALFVSSICISGLPQSRHALRTNRPACFSSTSVRIYATAAGSPPPCGPIAPPPAHPLVNQRSPLM